MRAAENGKTACVQMLLSGTAAGVIGASHLGRLAGYPDLVTFDVGGTSADVAIVHGGRPQYGSGEGPGSTSCTLRVDETDVSHDLAGATVTGCARVVRRCVHADSPLFEQGTRRVSTELWCPSLGKVS